MAWSVEFTGGARKDLEGLGAVAQRRVLRFLRERVAGEGDPRRHGKPLKGTRSGLWRYRIGDWRAICRIEDNRLVVLVVAIGHRRDIYE